MKKWHIIIISICILLIIISFFPIKNNTSTSYSSLYNLPKFEIRTIKVKEDNQYTIKINNINEYNLNFKTESSNKIRIIESTNHYIKIEKVNAFENITLISLFVEGYSKIFDSLKVSCFNEILNINSVELYKHQDNSYSKVEKYDEGEYLIEFNLEKLNKSLPFEDDTLLEINEYLKMNLAEEIKKSIYYIDGNLSFTFFLSYDFVFRNSNYKTLCFTLNKAQFALTLEKSK